MPRAIATGRVKKVPIGNSSLQCNGAAPTYATSAVNLGISGSSPFTIAFWGYVNVTSGTQTFVALGNSSGANTGIIISSSGNIWNLFVPGLGTIPVANPIITPNILYEVFVIYNGPGSSIVIGVNGLVINDFSTLTMNLVNTPIVVARDYNGASPITGGISDLRIWNVALTPTQVSTMCSTRVVPTTGLVRRYLFNDGTGSTAIDSSPSASNLTITNPYWAKNFVPYGLPIKASSTPAQLPKCLFYYEADQGITLDVSNKVSQWNDLSGNGSHMLQTTPSLRFGYTASSVNGLPSVNLTTGTLNAMSAVINYFANQPHTLVVVARASATQSALFSGILALGSGGVGGQTSSIGTDNSRKLWFGGTGDGTPLFFEPVNGTTYLLVKKSDGSFITSYINHVNMGVTKQLVTYSVSPLMNAVIGQYSAGSDSGNWNVVSIAGFNKELSQPEMNALATYYNNKYAIGLTVGGRVATTGRVLIT